MLISLPSYYGAASATAQIQQLLFGAGQLGVFFVPEPVVLGEQSLYKLSNATDPVTADGDPVGWMRDHSGNGLHATQSVSADRPIYRTDGALHWLEFDGINHYMIASLSEQSQPVTLMAAASTDINSDVMNFIDGDDGSNSRRCLIGALSTDTFRAWSSKTLSAAATRGTVAHVLTGRINGVSSILRHDGVEIAAGDAGGNSMRGVSLGSDNTGSGQLLDGNIYGAIAVISELSSQSINSAEDYLAERSGVTI